MTFKDDEEALAFIKAHQTPPKYTLRAREEARELYALIEGDGFDQELINKIEHIESKEKALARKKYSRNIVDLYERLLLPISNVFSASGSNKTYNIDNDKILALFLSKIGNLRDNKSIQKYVESTWMPLYHTDPNGVIFMEYTTAKEEVIDGKTVTIGVDDVYPTYKSIYSIRAYKPKGQLLDVILFEPKKKLIRDESGQATGQGFLWRIVDDLMDRTFLQSGDSFRLFKSFKHPFGQVPGIVNSDIVKLGTHEFRISPIHKVKALTKEYARDQSIKTLYKFLQGYPIHWRYITECKSCQGTAKKGKSKCPDCDGKGFYMKKDVTDMVTLPTPKGADATKLAPDIAGFITPDLETWKQYNLELELLEALTTNTHWGTEKAQKGGNETATRAWIDVQPVMNRLNKYADVAEWVERQLTEWIARFYRPGNTDQVASVHYGRRYIIESPDVILTKYNEAREKGSNNVILDRLYNEYLTAKFGNDPAWLRMELLKSEVEPYLHLGVDKVKEIFGFNEAQKKALFTEWWKTLDEKAKDKEAKILKADYLKWFEENKIPPETPEGDK